MTENELIAEFMGGVRYKKPQHSESFKKAPSNVPFKIGTFLVSDELEYDKSWDWLMPVVEKIDKMTLVDETYFRTNVNGSRNRTHCYIYKYHPGESVGHAISEGHEDKKIESVYRAVIEFIKWYNNNDQTGVNS